MRGVLIYVNSTVGEFIGICSIVLRIVENGLSALQWSVVFNADDNDPEWDINN